MGLAIWVLRSLHILQLIGREENACLVTREETYLNLSKDEKKPEFVPLDAIGKDFM